MNLLFIGDVVGKSGCDFLGSQIYSIKKEYGIDFTVVNGENSAQGNGITFKSFDSLIRMGADVVTTGNHCFKRKESVGLYDRYRDVLLRPANFPAGVEGSGFTVIDKCPVKIAVVNLMGTLYMESLDNPFEKMDEILSGLDTPNIFVDFHAEATSEKKAMGFYLQGKVTAVMGTHTHVQTSDEVILPKSTAYITDVGMTGPELSVLGVESEIIVRKLKYHTPVRFEESKNPPFINGVVVSFDEKSGKATNITRIIRHK
ncbi:MAG: TIGR00282 family metallophosphoesterase [Ruminococcus sp.]|nr:TIGR00282 family metallophosphoesterase [Ruminococcus sp.]